MAPHDCRRLLLAQLHVAPLHPAAPVRTRPVAPPAAPRAPDTAASPHHPAPPDAAFARTPLAPRGPRAR